MKKTVDGKKLFVLLITFCLLFSFVLAYRNNSLNGSVVDSNNYTTESLDNLLSGDAKLLNNFSSYFGGLGNEYRYTIGDLSHTDIALDHDGNIIMVGRTSSANFPTVNAYQSSFNGGVFDAFVTKISPDGQEIIFSTFLGGSGEEWATEIVVDSDNNIVVIGTTASTNFPTLNPLYPSHSGGGEVGSYDIFITRFNHDGQSLNYSTFLGGSGDDWGYGIDCDSNDNIIVTGSTYSADFPILHAHQDDISLEVDFYITKLHKDGQSLNFSTFMGAAGNDGGQSLECDSDDNIIAFGITGSGSFPIVGDVWQSGYGGGYDAAIIKLAPNGNVIFSSFLGGTYAEYPYSMCLDNNNDILVCGKTSSSSFPTTTNAIQPTKADSYDGFFSRITSDGSELNYSSFLGGKYSDAIYDIECDSLGNMFLIGATDSTDFPLVNPFNSDYESKLEGFLTIVNAQGTSTLLSTYLTGNNDDRGRSIIVDDSETIYVSGYTTSTNFHTKNALQGSLSGTSDMFLMKFTIGLQETIENSLPIYLVLPISFVFVLYFIRKRKQPR